jgi:ureidoglycolate lyase
MPSLKPRPLIRSDFAPFGDVIEMDNAEHFTINQGFAERYVDLAKVDVGSEGGSTHVSLVLGQPRPKPIAIKLMERHPLGSQIFLPLQERPWLIVVCEDMGNFSTYRAFKASGRQGINYARNIWHHPLLVLDQDSRFVVVDRKGPGDNLEEAWLTDELAFSLEA